MKLLALMPIAAAAVSVSLDADLKAMKDSLQGIALAAQKEGKQINQTTIDVVALMLSNINSTLVDALHVDKKAAQDTLTAAWQAVEDCSTTRSNTFSGSIAAEEGTMNTTHDGFIACKNGEAGSDNRNLLQQTKKHGHREVPTTVHDYGYNFSRSWHHNGTLSDTSHEVHAHSEEERLCKILNDTVKSFATKIKINDVFGHPETAYSHYCEDHDASNWTDLFRTNQKLVDKSYEWFAALDTFESNNAAEYKRERDACHQARHRHVVRVVECNRLQHVFENAYCTWSNAIESGCHLYETCWDAQWATWSTTNTTAKNLEDQMKKQQEALEHLMCYGREIMKGETDLSKCDGLECAKCDDYTLSYVPPHDKITCTENRGTNKPCDSDWINNYMADFPSSAHPLEQCQACNDAVLVDWSDSR